DAFILVAAATGGSFVYWFVVSERIALLRHRLDEVQLGRINALAGLVLIGFGAVLIGEIALRSIVHWGVGQRFGGVIASLPAVRSSKAGRGIASRYCRVRRPRVNSPFSTRGPSSPMSVTTAPSPNEPTRSVRAA